MSERYFGYLSGGTPISSWERNFNTLENVTPRYNHGVHRAGSFTSLHNNSFSYPEQLHHSHRARLAQTSQHWGSMSEGGGISSGAGDSSKTNLIVNYLPQTMTEKDLYAMFMTIGPIESCRVMKDFKTGYSYGFGFVNFTREEDAGRAIDTFNGYQLRNKRLKVSYARPSGDDIKETNLYVTNLPRAITEEQLETIFGKYGRIVQKHILRDKSSGTPRGVAFVRYDKREEAQEAIAALNNVIPEGGTEPLSVKPVCGESTLRQGSAHNRTRNNHSHLNHMVAEEHGKQKAAYYAGYAAGFHHNRGDFAWGCGGCLMQDPWERFPSPPLGGSHPGTPRNGMCQRPSCTGPRPYPNYLPGKGTPRPSRATRNPPWAPTFEERYKTQRCRSGPPPYW